MAKGGGGEFLKWGLLGLGGFLLYRVYSNATTAASSSATPPASAPPLTLQHLGGSPIMTRRPGPISAGPISVAPISLAPADAATVSALVNAAGGATALDADQWNYYWSQLSHVEQTADLFPPNDRSAQMSASDYINARGAAGLSTSLLEGVSGLGGVRLPVPLMFARAADGTPIMFVPPNRKGAV